MEGPDELAAVRILHVLSLIEMSARNAREMRCHGGQLMASAASRGVEVVHDANVIAAVRGNGSARIGPSEKALMEKEAKQALGVAMAQMQNVVNMAGRLRELVGGRSGE